MACRLATAVLDMFLMYITVSVAGLYDLLMKVIVVKAPSTFGWPFGIGVKGL